MPTYRVTITKKVEFGKPTPGRLVEDVEINARDDYSARSLVQSQYGNTYTVGQCFKIRD